MAIDYANKQTNKQTIPIAIGTNLNKLKNTQNEKHQQSNHRSINQHLRS